MIVNHDTSAVLKSIGLPSDVEGCPNSENIHALFELASLNKIALLFLESLTKFCDIRSLKADLLRLRKHHTDVTNLTSHLSRVFKKQGVSYAFFKTLKPFPSTPADVDVLLESQADVIRAFKALKNEGITPTTKDKYSLNMYSKQHKLTVDLHLELSVSNLVYLNKRFLFRHVVEREVNGVIVKTLDECAEMVAVCAHSFYKEHMFMLSDYYTIALLAKNVSPNDLCELIYQTNSCIAVSAAFKLADILTTKAFGIAHSVSVQSLIVKVLKQLRNSKLVRMMISKSLKMPYEYPKVPIILALYDKILSDSQTRSSLPKALVASASTSQLKMLLTHFSRKSY